MIRVHTRAVLPALVALIMLFAIALGPTPGALAEAADETSAAKAASTAEAASTADDAGTLEIATLDELSGKKLGTLNGGTIDQLVMQAIDGVEQSDFLYFNSNAEAVGALTARKIDVMITDLPIALLAESTNDGIGIIPEPIVEDHYGYVLPKGSSLTAQLNERLTAYHKDGTIDALVKKWTGADESAKTMPAHDWPTPNGTLVVATTVDNAPVNYYVDNEPYGLSIELLELMARDLGYDLTYRSTSSASVVAEVQSGKADIAAGSFSITDERKQVVDMSEPYYDGGVTAVVRTVGGTDSDQGFLGGLAASFRRTFIDEDRWMLILSGLGVTLLISVGSAALGLALGFLLVLLRRRNEGGITDKLIHLFENVLGGLPVVVVLMVFYYVVFGSVSISGIIVAILVFTLLFGASSGSTMWNAIRAVDTGQAEAGRALGFGDRDTFLLVVLPQAARQFVPLLLGQFVSLIKDTSVVGFIAVQDLTRVGDLIRARTMEAFFPLIAIAIIYFAACRLLAWALGLLARRLEPQDGPRTIKGVDLR